MDDDKEVMDSYRTESINEWSLASSRRSLSTLGTAWRHMGESAMVWSNMEEMWKWLEETAKVVDKEDYEVD